MVECRDVGYSMKVCPNCGVHLDRDINASRNIMHATVDGVVDGVEDSKVQPLAPGVLGNIAAKFSRKELDKHIYQWCLTMSVAHFGVKVPASVLKKLAGVPRCAATGFLCVACVY